MPKDKDGTAPSLPPTSSSFWLTLMGCALFGLLFVGGRSVFPLLTAAQLTIPCVIATIFFLIAGEVLLLDVRRRPRLLQVQAGQLANWRVRTLRMSAVLALFVAAGSLYLGLPFYHSPLYQDFMSVLPVVWGLGLGVTLLHIGLVDIRGLDESDPLLHLGRLICGRWKEIRRQPLFSALRNFLMRVFFIPFLFEGVVYCSSGATESGMAALHTGLTAVAAVALLYLVMAGIDMLTALMGYITTIRQIDTDTRSTDPSFLGWLICMICYHPFIEVLYLSYFLRSFLENPKWLIWFQAHPLLCVLWGTAVVGTQAVENLTTLCFGLRFSNLTYRGLISSGPYRFTKHPQYVAKIINRFLVSVPFLSLAGGFGVLANLGGFMLLVAVYFLRARTEERHLSAYPEYVAYARAMNQRSIFRCVPGLQYKG